MRNLNNYKDKNHSHKRKRPNYYLTFDVLPFFFLDLLVRHARLVSFLILQILEKIIFQVKLVVDVIYVQLSSFLNTFIVEPYLLSPSGTRFDFLLLRKTHFHQLMDSNHEERKDIHTIMGLVTNLQNISEKMSYIFQVINGNAIMIHESSYRFNLDKENPISNQIQAFWILGSC